MAVMMRTWLEVADNSGRPQIAGHPAARRFDRIAGWLGDVVTASVKEASPDGQVKKGTVVKRDRAHAQGVLAGAMELTFVSTKDAARADHTNRASQLGTRVFGPVARELREKKFLKIGCPWHRSTVETQLRYVFRFKGLKD